MLICPMCKKQVPEHQQECLNCRTDVSLLVSYVENLQDGLKKADGLTRQGRLGEAVWAYLGVLEVDPDNAQARRQVGQVATAVRQFDENSYRRWKQLMHRGSRLRRWMSSVEGGGDGGGLLGLLFWGVVVVVALFVGFYLGRTDFRAPSDTPTSPPTKKAAALPGGDFPHTL